MVERIRDANWNNAVFPEKSGLAAAHYAATCRILPSVAAPTAGLHRQLDDPFLHLLGPARHITHGPVELLQPLQW